MIQGEVIKLWDGQHICNVIGTASEKYSNYSWKDFYCAHAKDWPGNAVFFKCDNPPEVGGHVYLKMANPHYARFLVPLCHKCNKDWDNDFPYWQNVLYGTKAVCVMLPAAALNKHGKRMQRYEWHLYQ